MLVLGMEVGVGKWNIGVGKWDWNLSDFRRYFYDTGTYCFEKSPGSVCTRDV